MQIPHWAGFFGGGGGCPTGGDSVRCAASCGWLSSSAFRLFIWKCQDRRRFGTFFCSVPIKKDVNLRREFYVHLFVSGSCSLLAYCSEDLLAVCASNGC